MKKILSYRENPISKAGKEVSGLYNETTDGVEKFLKKTKKGATGLYDDTTGDVGNFFLNLWRSVGNVGIGVLNTFPKLFSTVINFVSNTFVEIFSSFYTSKVEVAKANKLVKGFGIAVFVCAIGIIFFTLKEEYNLNEKTKLVQVEKEKPKKIEKQKKEKKEPEKKPQKKN